MTRSSMDDPSQASQQPPPGVAIGSPQPAPPPAVQRLLKVVDRYRLIVLLILLAVHAAAFTGQWRPTPDSALHLQIARNLARGEGFTHLSGQHVSVSPGLAWLTAATFRIFGDGVLWPAHLLMLAMGLVALVAVYRLFLRYTGRPAAVLLTAMLALSATFFRYSFYLLTDTPFLLGAALTLLGIERLRANRPSGAAGWLSFAFILAGIAIMAAFRSVVLTFVAALVVFLLWKTVCSTRRWRYLAGAGVIACIFGLTRVLQPGGLTSLSPDEQFLKHLVVAEPVETIRRLVTDNLPKLLLESTPEAMLGVDIGPVPGVAMAMLLFFGVGLLARRRPLWALIIGAFVGQWLLLIVTTRYFLPILPLLLLAWWHAALWFGRRLPAPWDSRVIVVVLGIWFLPNIVLVAKFIGWQRHVTIVSAEQDDQITALHTLSARINELPPTMPVASPTVSSFELTYLTDRYVRKHPGAWAADRRVAWCVVEPLDEAMQTWLQAESYELGEPLLILEESESRPQWTLRPMTPVAE